MLVEGRQVDEEGDEEQQHRRHDQKAGNDPQGRPQLLPAPARQLTAVLADACRLGGDELFGVGHDETGDPQRRGTARTERQVGTGMGMVMGAGSLVADQSSRHPMLLRVPATACSWYLVCLASPFSSLRKTASRR